MSPVLNGLRQELTACGLSGSVRPYRRVFLVEQTGNCEHWILKPLRLGAARAVCIGKLLTDGAGWGLIPEKYLYGDGPSYLWYRGNRYLITRLLPGRVADYHDPQDLRAAIRAMESFHRLTCGLLKEDASRWAMLRFDPAGAWRIRLGELINCKKLALRLGNDWSRRFLQIWDEFYEQAQAALEELEQFLRDPPTLSTLCYHDWAYHNVLIDSGTAYLIDFDEILQDHPAHDRANLIGRYLRLAHWSAESLYRIVREFNLNYPWRRGELKLTGIYLRFPYDYWILGRQYYIEQQPWSRRYYDDQWQRKISFNSLRLKLLDILARME